MKIFMLENCQLEWNRRDGVLYVHNKDTGTTVLRLQGLPATRDSVELGAGKLIDIRVPEGAASVPLY